MATQQKPQQGRSGKKKQKKNIPSGRCYIRSGFGNTIVTFTEPSGGAVCWSSSGLMGFKGNRKGTPFAAQMTAQDAARKAKEHGMRFVDVYLVGPGSGRETAVRAVVEAGIRVNSLKDITPLPHNGCRPPKRRRV